MRMYLVRGPSKGARELILSTSKERAQDISELRKLGETTVKTLDKKPKLRVAVDSENERTDYIEWKDIDIEKWHSYITIDPALYQDSELELVGKC